MSDSATSQAVVYIDDKPHLELTAEELIYPIRPRDDQPQIHFHFKPYLPYAVKKFYDGVIPRRKRLTTTTTSIETPDYTQAKQFVSDHFLGMSNVSTPEGVDPTPEQQIAWLEANETFKIRLWRECFDTWVPKNRSEPDTPKGKSVLVFGRPNHIIPTEITLYSPDRNLDARIEMVHELAHITESQRHQYDKAVSVIENSRSNTFHTEANWDVIEGTYNQLVRTLKGALLAGQPCTEANKDGKDGWLARIPFCCKVYVMNEVNREVEVKNA